MSALRPESTMEDLVKLFPVIYASLEYGRFKAKEFFETQEHEEDKIIDRYLAPSHVRFHAVRHLKRAGQDAYEDTDNNNELTLVNVPNNGIHINYGRYQIKILKSNHGELPVPGHSNVRKNFYDQQFLNYYDTEMDSVSAINLIVLWNVNEGYNSLGTLSLACPKSGRETRESVEHHFHCKIPVKLLYGEFNINDDIIAEEIFDLPLNDIDLDQTGTGE